MKKAMVGIIMGSDSDLEVMAEAAKILNELTIISEVVVLSAHRTPEETAKYAASAKGKGLKVLIAGAGGAAALPGSIAALTTLPVIGVPIQTKALKGVDSLFSIVSMPPGTPVATVGIDSAKNAGILAAEIIALTDKNISQKVEKFKERIRKEVLLKNDKLKKIGFEKYLNGKQK